MATGTGTATVNFGSPAGSSMATTVVTGQAGITSGAFVEVWVRPEATATHSEDEHRVEALKFSYGDIVAATGFTIYGECINGQATGIYNVNWVWST